MVVLLPSERGSKDETTKIGHCHFVICHFADLGLWGASRGRFISSLAHNFCPFGRIWHGASFFTGEKEGEMTKSCMMMQKDSHKMHFTASFHGQLFLWMVLFA